MKIAAAYIRVSTDDQTEYSPVAQLNEIKKYAASHDLLLDDRYIYTEEGISGRSAKKRPQFNEMIAASKQSPPPFQTILLWKFSRFARNQEESIVYKTMLRKSGVDVISVSEPLSEGPFGSLIERIIEWMDEYYSIRLSGEVLRGMTEKARRGEFQSAPPFGYAKLPGLPLTIVENEAAIIRMIFDNYDAGGSFFSIARNLNAMGITTKRGNPFENRTIEYMIRNPVYIGCARWTPTGKTVSKRIYDSSDTMIVSSKDIPAIISKEQFERVNERACKERRHRKRNSRPAEAKNTGYPESFIVRSAALLWYMLRPLPASSAAAIPKENPVSRITYPPAKWNLLFWKLSKIFVKPEILPSASNVPPPIRILLCSLCSRNWIP